MEILYYFYVSVWKNTEELWKKYAIIGVDIDIDKYRYFSHHKLLLNGYGVTCVDMGTRDTLLTQL